MLTPKDVLKQREDKANREKLESAIDKLSSSLGELRDSSSKGRQNSTQTLLNEITKVVQLVAQSHNLLVGRVDDLEKVLAKDNQLSRENIKTLLGGTETTFIDNMRSATAKIDALSESVDSIDMPETDLAPLIDGVADLSSKVSSIKMPVIPKRKEKFTFKIKRDDEGLIENVTVV